MEIATTEAKNCLGQMLDHCQREPVVVEKSGHRHGPLLSVAHCDALVAASPPVPKRGDAGQAFYAQHKGWVEEQNRLVEQFGIPAEAFRLVIR